MTLSRSLTHAHVRWLFDRIVRVRRHTDRLQERLKARGLDRTDPVYRELADANAALSRLSMTLLRLGIEVGKDERPGWAETARRDAGRTKR